MRVLQVVPGISPKFGGPSVANTSLARSLNAHGVDTTLITTDADPEAPLQVPLGLEHEKDGAKYIYEHARTTLGRWSWSPGMTKRLREITSAYDIVHIHWIFNHACFAAGSAARSAGVPYVVQPNGSLDPRLWRKNRHIKNIYVNTAGKALLQQASAIIFTSEAERDQAVVKPTGDSWIVPVGLDLATYTDLPAPGAFRRAFGIVDPFLLFLGRLSPQKGLDLLVSAFAAVKQRHPALKLVIAGPDPDDRARSLRQLAKASGLEEDILFPGMLTHEQKLAAFIDAELFVLPSVSENFGAVATEALLCETPVLVSTGVNIHPEIAAAGAGIVVRRTVESIASGIENALSDPEKLAAMGAAGRRLVLNDYTWDAVVPTLIEHYQACIESGAKSKPTIARPSRSPERLRILHVISSVSPEKGGPSKTAVELSRTLAKRGHHVELFTTTLGAVKDLDPLLSAAKPAIPTVFPVRTPAAWGFSPELASALSRRIQEFDVVHIHSVYMFHTAVAARLCQHYGIPYIIRPHGTLDPFLRSRGRLKKWLYTTAIEKHHLDRAAAIHYTSEEEMRTAHQDMGIRAPGIVVGLGVHPDDYLSLPDPEVFKSRFPETRGKKILLFLSRLNFKKGIDVLVDAMAELSSDPNLHLVLAGPDDDGYGREIRGWLRARDIESRVTFTGMLVGSLKLAAYSAATLSVLPSYTESFGFAAVEALAAGVPLVVSDQVHLAPVFDANDAAIVTECTATSVAAGMRRVIEEPGLASRLRANGQALVAREFTWDRVVEILVPRYRQLIEGSPQL